MKKINKIKNWIFENKGKVAIGVVGLLALGVTLMLKTEETDGEQLEIEGSTEFDLGREIIMEFRTKDGELLGKIGCCESYMDEMMVEEFGEDYRTKNEEA
jgi:hypothetical protein